MNEPLAQVFRYNKWANERIIDASRALTEAQLDARAGGDDERTIRETLFHIATGQLDFIARLRGVAQDPDKPQTWPGIDAVTELAARADDALVATAEAMNEDSDVVVPFAGQRPSFPRSFFLTHAIAHGTQHRTEICDMMRALGLEPPNLDAWDYAAAAGFGTEHGR